ncbi:hypothetical protein D9756_008312 [Leucocoprinus leucothites]|uniref:Uncharacterized protein n=1 Tax=Leucocoprinus leucothites TaxID=201217 RepID=A0A8H5D0S5_9AGAR|nr:hypothetical protein D9756_008312 [Leucoagaricus leucothites]
MAARELRRSRTRRSGPPQSSTSNSPMNTMAQHREASRDRSLRHPPAPSQQRGVVFSSAQKVPPSTATLSPPASVITVAESLPENHSPRPTEPVPPRSPSSSSPTTPCAPTTDGDQLQTQERRATFELQRSSPPPSSSSSSSSSSDMSRQSWQPTEPDLNSHRSQSTPETINSGASRNRSGEPIRLSLAPSSRLSADMLSMISQAERSPSLAEFPLPPPRSLSRLFMLSPSHLSRDEPRELGNSHSSVAFPLPSSPNNSTDNENIPPLTDRNQVESPVNPPSSTTGTPPPSYRSGWRHALSLSQTSVSTLPVYPGREDDDRASVHSRIPSRRSSTVTPRGVRNRRTLPPIPAPPPLPSPLPVKLSP